MSLSQESSDAGIMLLDIKYELDINVNLDLTSLLRRLQVQTLPDASSPLGKIRRCIISISVGVALGRVC